MFSSVLCNNNRECAISKEARYAIVATAVGGVVLYNTVKKYKDWQEQRELLQRVKARHQYRKDNLQALSSRIAVNGVLVTREREEILAIAPNNLVEKIKNGEYKAVDVLRAYQAKAIEATKKTNCIAYFLDEAESWAKSIDELSSDADLPLRGLPVSLKEDMAITGHDSTAGYAKFLGKPKDKDATIVAGLKRLGAVPFCRTNLPQTVLSYSCNNPIYGATRHPTHLDRCPGGSSGGEGSLNALGGSVFGIGDDITGSVRIPAHFCGIATLRPTMGRIIATGQFPALPGVIGMCNTPGVMAKTVDTVILGSKALFQTKILHHVDPRALPIPWDSETMESTRRLRIGYYDDSNFFPVFPGCKRAVHEAVEALRSQGHTLVKMNCPDSFESAERMIQFFYADGGKFMLEKLKNDNVDPIIMPLYDLLRRPKWIRDTICKWYQEKFARRGRVFVDAIPSSKLWSMMMEREQMRSDVIDTWETDKLDVVIGPAYPFPAIPAKETTTLFSVFICTGVYSHLDFPAGTVPVTRESAEDQKKLESYDTTGDTTLQVAKDAVRGGEGLPIGVQVISYPYREEIVLRVMKEVQDSLKKPFH